MRVAITGDRNWSAAKAIESALRTLNAATDFVVLGDADGADTLARLACGKLGLRHRVHDADWKSFGRAAGPIRNEAMLDDLCEGWYDEVLLDLPRPLRELWYFHDDLARSKGTKNCVEQARKRGITIRDGRTVR